MTEPTNFNNPNVNPRVLVAPLEWGLGHATRCIPIIHELINNGCEVLIGAEGATAAILKSEFPDLEFLPIIPYRVRYSRRKKLLPAWLFLQLPKIILTIYREHKWLAAIVNQYKLDAVISDNRFGLYHKKIKCIYITHQLVIKTNRSFSENAGQRMHCHFIKKYNECWVPDSEQNGLAGQLSHPSTLPGNVTYIGPLSRFEKHNNVPIKYDLLVVISGPEPQRSIFEKTLLHQLKEFEGKVLFVRGLPGNNETMKIENPLIEIVSHLSASELNLAIEGSSIMISRSGYTTIMDIVKLHKKAILVPTPGQTEQEYLASYLSEKKLFYSVAQEKFDLGKALAAANDFQFDFSIVDMDQYKKVIRDFVGRI